jgi:hypothetical protein
MTRFAAAVLAAVALAGCGSAKDARRSAFNHYIARVNEVQREALVPWSRARHAYAGIGHGRITDGELRDLDAASKTIRSLRARIAALSPPKDANRLHSSLLRLLDLDASFAAEVESFARYVRSVTTLQTQLGSDTAQLRRELRRSRAPAKERYALTRYAVKLDPLVARFRLLRPPPALTPWHGEQIARIDKLRRGARELALGLARRNSALTQRGLSALTGAAANSPATAADRAAILAYDARLKRLGTASAVVVREENRLERELA